jgi:hypothetical protein
MVELTAYELERLERINQNKQRMLQVGLDATLNEINSTARAEQQARRPAPRASPRPLTAAEKAARRAAMRRSNRCVDSET